MNDMERGKNAANCLGTEDNSGSEDGKLGLSIHIPYILMSILLITAEETRHARIR